MPTRAEVMAKRWTAGETLQAIGNDYGISRQRVQQILRAHGLRDASETYAARRRARERKDAQEQSQLRAWLRTHPGASLTDAAAALGWSATRVGELLDDPMRARLVRRVHRHEARLSDEDMLQWLRRAAAQVGEPMSYDAYVACDLPGKPPGSRFEQRFGTWTAACRAAGLAVRSPRRSYSRRWSQERAVELVADYLGDAQNPSFTGYDEWARRQHNAPSAATVRNLLGSWAAAKAAALQLWDSRRP